MTSEKKTAKPESRRNALYRLYNEHAVNRTKQMQQRHEAELQKLGQSLGDNRLRLTEINDESIEAAFEIAEAIMAKPAVDGERIEAALSRFAGREGDFQAEEAITALLARADFKFYDVKFFQGPPGDARLLVYNEGKSMRFFFGPERDVGYFHRPERR